MTGDKVEYECELEISDVNYLLNRVNDINLVRRSVRRFLLNQIYISKIIGALIAATKAKFCVKQSTIVLNSS